MSFHLIVSGMHRSGTSLVTSVLQKAGLYIGQDINGPGRGNPRGHFEDLDFYRLHEDMLAAADKSCFSAGPEFAPPERADFEERARMLIAEREAFPLWGWKDPRTCLFLGFWDRLLPEARYLFLYRHPVDVALSLWRRNTNLELRQDPWLAIRSWEVYNRRLLEFRRRHPQRTFLAQVPAVAADLGDLVRRLRVQLGLLLRDASAASLYAPEELASLALASPAWEKLIPGALELYRQLEESADLPARSTDPFSARRPAREQELLEASESLFRTLLENSPNGGSLLPSELRLRIVEEELEEERLRSAKLAADLRHERLVLAEIQGSRSFAPVRAWWRLRRRFAGERM